MPAAMTDYQIELARIDKDIAKLQASALIPPVDTEKATRYVHGLYQRAASGRYATVGLERIFEAGFKEFLKLKGRHH